MGRRWVAPALCVVVAVGAGAGTAVAARDEPLPGDAARGEALYVPGCSSCHGLDGRGVEGRGPTLWGTGRASVDFWVGSGRMPAAVGLGKQSQRKPPAYDAQQTADLAAYVHETFGGGPEIPVLDPGTGDLPEGQQLYTANCAGCHNSAGSGGALGKGVYAPAVYKATDRQVAEAVRIGPGSMPAFAPGTLDDEQLTSIVRYVEHLRTPEDRGGLPLGRTGPVPEGMVAWLVGMTALLVAARLIGTRT